MAWLASSPSVLTEHISSTYTYVWRYVKHNSSTCHVYVMWAELDHSHFLYVPAVSNIVTNGNGTGTKNVLMEPWLRFVFSIQSSVHGATTVAKISLFSTWTRSTVSFTLCKCREIDPYSCEQTLVIQHPN